MTMVLKSTLLRLASMEPTVIAAALKSLVASCYSPLVGRALVLNHLIDSIDTFPIEKIVALKRLLLDYEGLFGQQEFKRIQEFCINAIRKFEDKEAI